MTHMALLAGLIAVSWTLLLFGTTEPRRTLAWQWSNGAIEGLVYYDRDGDRERDVDEPGYVPVSLFLFQADGALAAEVSSTREPGTFRFEVPEGTYWLYAASLIGTTTDSNVPRALERLTVRVLSGETTRIELGLDIGGSLTWGLPGTVGAPPPVEGDPFPQGRWFRQMAAPWRRLGLGYPVVNGPAARYWDAFQQYGGVYAVGYPLGQPFGYRGFTTQAFQKLVLQWQPGVGALPVNVFDELHVAGKDAWLEQVRSVPPPFDTGPDDGQPWDVVVARHLGFLDPVPALKARYFAEADPITVFGLPMSVKDYGDVVVVRCQRAVLQQWKTAKPWAGSGQVVVANGGSVAAEAGLFPEEALRPVPPP